jgi:hypothetical protein
LTDRSFTQFKKISQQENAGAVLASKILLLHIDMQERCPSPGCPRTYADSWVSFFRSERRKAPMTALACFCFIICCNFSTSGGAGIE